MKSLILLSVLFLSGNTLANPLHEYWGECRNTEVIVEEIRRDSHIKGRIEGLPKEAYEEFKVVFYVKTNRWYVHPYTWHEGQEEGYSFSNINENGEFKVKTVRRDVPSRKLAVVVVPKNYKIRSQRLWLRPFLGIFGGVLRHKCAYTLVEGNGDFLL